MNKLHKRSRFSKLIAGCLVSIVFLGVGYAGFECFGGNFYTKDSKPAYLYIRSNTSFNELIHQMQSKGIVKNINSFTRLAKLTGCDKKLRQGRYAVTDGMSNIRLIRHLSYYMQTPVSLKLNNIRTKQQLAGKLSKQLMADSLTFITLLNDTASDSTMGFTPETIIAMFIPNTYEVYWDITPTQLFAKMYHEYQQFWTEERLQKAQSTNLTPVEVITLASIVEEETNLKHDKPIVAGLYLNRLRDNIPLQADPTLRFACNDFTLKRLTMKQILVRSPYNTYLNKGLPPGPIRIPSIESIDAVLNYEPSNYLYMCAKETLNGEHYFAATWEEHKKNAAKYAAKLNELGIH